MINTLKDKILQRKARVTVIGLGYVGLPLAVEFAKNGFTVIGIDSNRKKITELNAGASYVIDITSNDIAGLIHKKLLIPTSDYKKLKETDCICICVPTPLNKTKDPDISFILEVTKQIKNYLHPGQLICLESTTYPGTTKELILPALSESGLKVGKDFFLAFSPERIDPGNKVYTIKNTPKIVSGITPHCREIVKLLYSQIVETVVVVSSTETAEITKLLENTFRIVNIGLVNELAIMCDKLGIDIWEVIEAAATKPFGFMKFYPGPGLGGHCIPIDPHYLSWKLKLLNYRARFIELAGEINSEMPQFVAWKVIDGLNRFKKSVNGSRILLVGVAYKKDISDVRESPALDIFGLLQSKGAQVRYYDPYVANLQVDGKINRSCRLTPQLLREMDCAVIVTNHSDVDYNLIERESKLIVDTRNVYAHSKSNKIIRL